jgi:peptidoglycan hydrolase-like protein with peptidoglycan-binding domain
MTIDQGRLVQRALSHLGYYDGKPDGIFGPDTRAAIRRWQYEEHQPMTGHLTAGEASKLAATWD